MASLLDLKRYCNSNTDCDDCKCYYLCRNRIYDCTDETIRVANNVLDTWVKVHPTPSYLDELLKRMPALKGHEKEFVNKICVETMFDTKVRDSTITCLAGNCLQCWKKDYKGEE